MYILRYIVHVPFIPHLCHPQANLKGFLSFNHFAHRLFRPSQFGINCTKTWVEKVWNSNQMSKKLGSWKTAERQLGNLKWFVKISWPAGIAYTNGNGFQGLARHERSLLFLCNQPPATGQSDRHPSHLVSACFPCKILVFFSVPIPVSRSPDLRKCDEELDRLWNGFCHRSAIWDVQASYAACALEYFFSAKLRFPCHPGKNLLENEGIHTVRIHIVQIYGTCSQHFQNIIIKQKGHPPSKNPTCS